MWIRCAILVPMVQISWPIMILVSPLIIEILVEIPSETTIKTLDNSFHGKDLFYNDNPYSDHNQTVAPGNLLEGLDRSTILDAFFNHVDIFPFCPTGHQSVDFRGETLNWMNESLYIMNLFLCHKFRRHSDWMIFFFFTQNEEYLWEG